MTDQSKNLLDQARDQYPVLKKYDYGYTENYQPNAGYLEHWEPGDKGAEPSNAQSLDRLRPAELPLDKPGLEIRDPRTTPMDVLGDITSHHLINEDPVVQKTYNDLTTNLTPNQSSILQDQYSYAQTNEGENRSFDAWKTAAGLPGLFRGYAFQQWPSDFNQKAYTPENMKSLDNMMDYLKTDPDTTDTNLTSNWN